MIQIEDKETKIEVQESDFLQKLLKKHMDECPCLTSRENEDLCFLYNKLSQNSEWVIKDTMPKSVHKKDNR